MKKKIAITGGTGFLGKNIIHTLQDQYTFINIGRNNSPFCKNIRWDLTKN
jgi:nucleoside-diphosphate-sugar epimerase